MTQPTRAQLAYAAYGAVTGHVTHDGRRMPAWDDLGDTIQAAWGAAVAAALPDQDQLAERLEQAFDDYIRELPDLNDIDAPDLAENLARVALAASN